MQKEISKLACAYSKTIDMTASVLSELNQKLRELRAAVLQNHAAVDCLQLKEHVRCKQFPKMCCFNLSDFSQTTQNQLDDIHHIVNKFLQMPKLSN